MNRNKPLRNEENEMASTGAGTVAKTEPSDGQAKAAEIATGLGEGGVGDAAEMATAKVD